MSGMVWYVDGLTYPGNKRPMTHSFSATEEQMEFARACRKKNDEGESLGPDCFPAEIFGVPMAEEKDYKLPNLFFAGSFWAVSKAAADVLRQFDLGGGGLFPVRVLKKYRVTPVDGEWFCIGFGNRKSALMPEVSQKVELFAQKRYRARATIGDNDITVSTVALSGPDIWIDSQMWDSLFLSEALGNALKKAKADKGFFLKKCRVI
jgi:hypothetical protein